MELESPEKSGFLIYNATGLGPVKAEVRTSQMATFDGSILNSARLSERNIVLYLIYYPPDDDSISIEELRHLSYKYFPTKKPIDLIVETDIRTLNTTGIVESNEPVIFSEQTYTQVSIVCPFPYFYGYKDTNTTVFSGIKPVFTFPWSNESLTEPLLIMGEIEHRTEQVIHYEGDEEIGVTIIMDAIGPVSNVTIYNVTTRQKMIINTERLKALTGEEIILGDQIILSTVQGVKTITLLRDGVSLNIMNTLDRTKDWFLLKRGDNIFAYEAESGAQNLRFKIENKCIYEGV